MAIGIAGQRIITMGMGVNVKACEGLITTHFSLLCRDIDIPPVEPPVHGGGGGPYPGDAWNKFDRAEDIFQPVDKDIYDVEDTYRVKKEVVIRVEFNNFHMEKTFLIPKERAHIAIKAIRIMNTTKARISAGVKNLRRVLHNIKVSVTGIRRKK